MDIKFLKKKKKFVKRNLEKKLDFFWKSILYITFILILISCAFGLNLFLETNKESMVVEDIGGKEMMEKERINNVLDYFSEREKKSMKILNSSSFVVDPSL